MIRVFNLEMTRNVFKLIVIYKFIYAKNVFIEYIKIEPTNSE